jgi:hypothetical protein
VTDDEYRARILRIEAAARDRVASLTTVSARARPSGGESNVLHDAVAAQSRTIANAAEIAAAEIVMHYLTHTVEADYYGIARPDPTIWISDLRSEGHADLDPSIPWDNLADRLREAASAWTAANWSAP